MAFTMIMIYNIPDKKFPLQYVKITFKKKIMYLRWHTCVFTDIQ